MTDDKALTLTESSLSNLNGENLPDYGDALKGLELDVADNKELFSNDILIPKIHLIQTMSELSKSREKMDGDYVDSRTAETLLPVDGPAEYLPLIVLKTFKRWHTFELVGDKKKFLSSEVMVLGKNENLKYEETVEGKDLRRRQVISAYVLLGEDAKKGINKPYIIDFAATSKGAGRDMVSDINVLNTDGIPSWLAWFKLSKFEETSEQGDYFVKKMAFGGYLPKEMMDFLKSAYDDIKLKIESGMVEIDDRDLNDAVKTNRAETKVHGDSNNAGI